MSRRGAAGIGVFCALLAGCCSDDGERPPWERDGAAPASARDGAAADGATDGGVAFEPVTGRIDLEGSRATVELGGLRVTPGGLVRGWLEGDLDADGDADAVLLQDRPPEEGQTERTLELLTYRRDEGELVATGGEPLTPALAGGCALSALSLKLAAAGAVTLVATTACPPADGAARDGVPAARSTAAAPAPSTLAALATGPFPLRQRVTARLTGNAVEVAMEAGDRDGDGVVDGILSLTRAGARAEVVWLDRTAGPSIDPTATEKSLAAAVPAPAGRKRLQANLPRLQGVVDLRRLLCTGTLEGSTLQLADRPAHECRTSRATGNAIAFLVRGHVDAGRIPQARAALGLLQLEGVGLGEERRAALEELIAAKTTLAVESEHEIGPVADVVAIPGGRAPVRFLDDDRIWVESSPPFIYFVSSRAAQPVDPLPAATPGPAAPAPAMPEARSGSHRAVGAAEGLWIGDGDSWALLPSARVGGAWQSAISLAISPSGDTVAAARGGRLHIVRLRRPAVLVPGPGDGGASGTARGADGGSGGAPTGERGP